ncbi:MAG: hypothetical protein JSV34_04645 [Candidatus Omnitrophota bacterium]|nr:MAG: hypothetical protein JSV34_04645 [Candidatus Omnitrophota bacterium]
MSKFKMFIFMFMVLILTGCASTIRYAFNKGLYVSDKPLPYKVVVDVFEDIRPSEERDGTMYKHGVSLYTRDRSFKADIDKQISQMLVEHLEKAKVFNEVRVRDVNDNLEVDIEEMEKLEQEGIDFVITGNLEHFYGFQSGVSGVAYAFGALGVLTEAIVNPKRVGGNVEYSDIKIIDVAKKEVLWRGNVKHDFEKKDVFYDGPVAYVLRALKEVNNKFVCKIKDTLPESSRGDYASYLDVPE